jgi:hypothetical protein
VHISNALGGRLLQGRAIAQAVSRWFPTAAARVRTQVRSCGICGGQSAQWGKFCPSTAPHSSCIIWDWYNRPISGRRTEWTQSHPKKLTLHEAWRTHKDVSGRQWYHSVLWPECTCKEHREFRFQFVHWASGCMAVRASASTCCQVKFSIVQETYFGRDVETLPSWHLCVDIEPCWVIDSLWLWMDTASSGGS